MKTLTATCSVHLTPFVPYSTRLSLPHLASYLTPSLQHATKALFTNHSVHVYFVDILATIFRMPPTGQQQEQTDIPSLFS